MKDIDFDELDRAVGSVLAGDNSAANDADATQKTDTPDVATATTVTATPDPVTSTSTDDSPTSPAPATPEANDVPVTTPEIKPSVSPARKRGQFLDMVHPSADMRKSSPIPVNTRRTIKPLSAAVAPDASEAKSPTEEPNVSTAPESPAPIATTSTEGRADASLADSTAAEKPEPQDNVWPDPLDFAKKSPDTSEATAETTPAADEDTPVAEATQTPFVTDAKVDKRPLGAFAPQEEEAQANEAPAAAPEAPAHPVESEEEAPEFNPEVNSVEATGVPQAEDEDTGFTGEAPEEDLALPEEPAPAPVVTEPKPDVEEVKTEEPQPSEVKPEEPAEAPEPAKPTVVEAAAAPAPAVTGAASIPQQYKSAEPNKDDDDAHPLFDTEEYHQPLLDGGKKKAKKGVLIVVLLLVLLVIGGALGYFAFTMGI